MTTATSETADERVIELAKFASGDRPVGNQNLEYRIPDNLHVVPANEDPDPSPDIGCFRVMTIRDGDKRITWYRRSLEQIREAKKMFMDLLKEGLVPYRVGTDGAKTSEVMDEFDPNAEEVIFLPVRQIAGG